MNSVKYIVRCYSFCKVASDKIKDKEFPTYSAAYNAVRRYLYSLGKVRNLLENGFYIEKSFN